MIKAKDAFKRYCRVIESTREDLLDDVREAVDRAYCEGTSTALLFVEKNDYFHKHIPDVFPYFRNLGYGIEVNPEDILYPDTFPVYGVIHRGDEEDIVKLLSEKNKLMGYLVKINFSQE